jgi:hypothetical protein
MTRLIYGRFIDNEDIFVILFAGLLFAPLVFAATM